MKKILISAMIALILLVGCSDKKTSTDQFEYVTMNDVKDSFSNKEDFVLIIGKDTCPACTIYKPVLNELVANKDTEFKYLDIIEETWSQDQVAEVVLFFQNELNQTLVATPTTFFVKGGKIVDVQARQLDYGELLKILKEYGFVQE